MSGYDPAGGGGGGWGQQPPAGGGGGGWGQQPPGGGGGGDAPVAQIPFSPDDEKAIGSMASLMVIAGVLSIAGSILGIITQLIQALRMPNIEGAQIFGQVCGGMFALAVVGFIAAMLIMAGLAFKRVVRSSDQDQVHLTDGLRKLRAYFMTKGILIVILLVCCCGAVIIGMIAATAMPRSGF